MKLATHLDLILAAGVALISVFKGPHTYLPTSKENALEHYKYVHNRQFAKLTYVRYLAKFIQLQPFPVFSELLATISNNCLDNIIVHLLFSTLADQDFSRKLVESKIALTIIQILPRSKSHVMISLLMVLITMEVQFGVIVESGPQLFSTPNALETLVSRANVTNKDAIRLLLLLTMHACSPHNFNVGDTAVCTVTVIIIYFCCRNLCHLE